MALSHERSIPEFHPIAIVGGGLGGLVFACVMQRHGLDVMVFEREPTRDSRGQGGVLDLHVDSGQWALAQAGLEAEFRALVTLYSRPDGVGHPGDLCAGTSQSPASMSRISDALVERGLITREMSVHDRRRMVLRVTQQGEELVRRLLPAMFAPLHDLFSDLSEAKQRQLLSVLKQLSTKVCEASTPNPAEAAE